jgi:hypothetical protein
MAGFSASGHDKRRDSELTNCSVDCGVKKVLLGVCNVEVELWKVKHVGNKKRHGSCNLLETQCE